MVEQITDLDGQVIEIETSDDLNKRAYGRKAAEGELEIQVGRERYRNNKQDVLIKAEKLRAQTIEDDIQTAAGSERVRVDDAIAAETLRAQTAEDEIITRAALEQAKNNAQDAMFSKQLMFGTVVAGTDVERPVIVVPGDCRLSQLSLVNAVALAADGANNTKLELINRGSDGLGSGVLATFDSATEAFVAFDAVTKLIGGPVDLVAGDVLSLKKTDTGAGAPVTDLLVSISCAPIP